jgi:hypothetical protein
MFSGLCGCKADAIAILRVTPGARKARESDARAQC